MVWVVSNAYFLSSVSPRCCVRSFSGEDSSVLRGSTVIRQLRAHEMANCLPRLPIIACTGSASFDAHRLWAAGADGVWDKPFPNFKDGTLQISLAAVFPQFLRTSGVDEPWGGPSQGGKRQLPVDASPLVPEIVVPEGAASPEAASGIEAMGGTNAGQMRRVELPSNIRVIVADDASANRLLLKYIFKKQFGWRVKDVATADEVSNSPSPEP